MVSMIPYAPAAFWLTFHQEYIWNYHFYQDGKIELEVRLTGILQTYVSKEGSPFGTTVAPNLEAQYHQHLFSIRVDPMVDGLNNSVIETDIVSLPGLRALRRIMQGTPSSRKIPY